MIRTEPIDKWVRGRVGGRVVVETREPLLVWQGGFPPVYAFRRDEVADGLLQPSDGDAYDGFFFHGPHAPVERWYDVVLGEQVLRCAAWSLDDDAVRDRVVLTWEPGRLQWTEEDEDVTGHPRDPHKRVEALASSRHVEVAIGGVTVASSDRPVLLLETDLPTRYYLPREDVRLDLLEPTENTSVCPYKGWAEDYWTWPGPPAVANVAWSYSSPSPAVGAIAGRVAFYDELVDVSVDGVPRQRPESPFSTPAQRPGADG
ncbi:DUF427 domain-containing protein [Nocardioides xinjiangensis]|uniref:DUF427 domain-containing protein n=1 Tax=Nocardioides xinjiangensis TaxID=2817376 RepID=UPI001B307848|nr:MULTISPECIES: DUF427 domain-containing protein [unclassified Nocardioides]